MFNRDVNAYRAAPRSLQTSKFGCYATLSVVPTRRSHGGAVMCYLAIGAAAVLMALWIAV